MSDRAASPLAASIFDLSGEVAFVSGASSGLGRRFATVLAANGARVALAGRREAELEKTADSIRAIGGTAVVLPFDLLDREAVPPVFDAAEAALGPVSVLINNAGIAGPGGTADLDFYRWRAILAVDLDALFVMAQEGASRMRERGGSIINVSSILGLKPARGDAAYAVAKAGVAQLSGVMALEYAASGIRVNTLAPGYVVTGMNSAFFASEASRAITDRIPLGRVGQVDDLDGAILYLASRASRFVTGSVLVVDGGHVLSM
ncbi:SDR family NAD(P)-dependent oxidoreductase [Kaistia adipata]|uniref:SDR family NAD(P)-dependent oxidoreductase n=1 Tax=Kaistia adipata TaxID=166954 RepID=UPI00041C8507|nr:SDR family NAD(P)-dependent oxidoreductase [Kaistia adipata]